MNREFTERLLAWYRLAGRDLPWRRTADPYAVWVSEAMLQQTQVATVLPYYDRWMRRFPSAEALAAASEEEALSLWQGLGYYRRCRNLQAGVRRALAEGWPSSAAEWRRLPGVGEYTAAALASICNGEAAAVVDGNVERVFARVCASDAVGPIRRRMASKWATGLISQEAPAEWNQAIMELGATVCKPRNPLCQNCPVAMHCQAHQSGTQDRFPAAAAKPSVQALVMPVSVPLFGNLIGLIELDERWWKGLWGFRFLEAPLGETLCQVRCTITNHRILMPAYLESHKSETPGHRWEPMADLAQVPMPAPMRKIAQFVAETRL